MQKLMEYTGGSIIITIAMICMSTIVLSVGIFTLFRNRDKKNIGKLDTIVTVISMIFISAVTGGIVGYYLGIFTMLR